MKWREHHDPPLPSTIYTLIARQVDVLRDQNATPAYVWAALLTWDRKHADGEKPKPGLLPYLHDEIKLAGLTSGELYATPTEYLHDADLDVFEILGYDDYQPEAPPEIENGPMDARRAWYQHARAERHKIRCVQAREVIARRQEIRRNAKKPA
jgi:hypothetical protein